jgi:hypothetical protein
MSQRLSVLDMKIMAIPPSPLRRVRLELEALLLEVEPTLQATPVK